MGQVLYDQWVAQGKPFKLTDPLVELRDLLRARGYTVYDIGNLDHLLHNPPEDHTPYSATGWPNPAKYGTGYAIDIMPNSRLTPLSTLGKWFLDDKKAGRIPWLKYFNWEPGDGNCWHESWQPNYSRVASSDRGHIHISARTDVLVRNGYDPFRRDSDMDGNQDLMLKQIHAILRQFYWQWTPDRAEFLRKGGDAATWDFMGGLSDNTEGPTNRDTLTLKAIANAVSGLGGLTTDDRTAIQRLTEAVEALNTTLKAHNL